MRNLKIVLLAESVVSLGLAAALYAAGVSNPMYILSVPFDFIGNELRWLSLHSTIGNIIALILYVGLSLLPIIYLIKRDIKKRLSPIDILLPVISIFSFIMLYEFINPGYMLKRLPQLLTNEDFLPLLKVTYAITFFTLCIGYLILRQLGSIKKDSCVDNKEVLCRRLQKVLIATSMIYAFLLSYFLTFQLFIDLGKIAVKSNQLSDPITMVISSAFPLQIVNDTVMNQAFTIVIYILKSLPAIFTILILLSGINLIKTMITDHLKENEIMAANHMGLISKRAVYVTVISSIVINLLQFLSLGKQYDFTFSLDLSLFPIIIAISAMILSGNFKETKDLYEDNEMII